jgi:hypothetical protein
MRTEIVSPSPTNVTVPYESWQLGELFPGTHGPVAAAAAEDAQTVAQMAMSRAFALRIKRSRLSRALAVTRSEL